MDSDQDEGEINPEYTGIYQKDDSFKVYTVEDSTRHIQDDAWEFRDDPVPNSFHHEQEGKIKIYA